MQIQPERRNNSIDIFRFIFASFAVLNHTHALWDIHPNAYFFVSEYLARCTVPYFLCVAGYYYCKALFSGRDVYLKQLFSMLKMYGVWTLIYYGISFAVNVVIGKESIVVFLWERVLFFFTQGSYPHLWYFPAMIYGMTIFMFVHRCFGRKGLCVYSLVCVLLYVVGVLGSAYLPIGRNLLFAGLYGQDWFPTLRGILCMGLPGFLSGYWVFRLEESGANKKVAKLGLPMVALFTVAEITMLIALNWVETPFMIFSFLPLPVALVATLLRNPMPAMGKPSWWARRQATAVFLIHPLILVSFQTILKLMGWHLTDTLLFLAVYISALLFGFVVVKIGGKCSKLLLGM